MTIALFALGLIALVVGLTAFWLLCWLFCACLAWGLGTIVGGPLLGLVLAVGVLYLFAKGS